MKRLKILLQHNIIYYVVLFIALFLYFVSSNITYNSVYNLFDEERFTITGITYYDYGIKLELKGKEKVLGYVYDNDSHDQYSIGDIVLISGKIRDISNNTVPNTFNYKRYLYSNKIYNVIVIDKIERIGSSKNIFYKLKNSLLKRTEKFTKSYPYVKALIFGINSYIDEDVKESYRSNGISHLFAISGLHISLFILIISKFLDKLRINSIVKSIILVLFLIFYMFLTSFAMSVVRCSIFTILLLLNKLLNLEIKSINLLLLTMSIIIFINPLSINNVGLQYSFLVTFFLIKYSYLLKGKGIAVLFKTSLIAFLVSYPITVNNFYQINLLSVFYNIIFVPYVSFILLPIVLITYLFPFLDNVLYIFIAIIENLSQFFEQFDFSKIILCKMDTIFIVSYFVIICKLLNKNSVKRTEYIFTLLLFFMVHYLSPLGGQSFVTFLDVNQGDSAVIRDKGITTVIDTGGIVTYDDQDYKFTLAKNRIIPYLKSIGIGKIDNLILTHGDADHMKEAKYLVENFKVEKVIFNCGTYNYLEKELVSVLDRKNIDYLTCIDSIDSFKFLNTKDYGNENPNSSVIYTEINGYKFMLMGDADIEREKDILDRYDISNIDVLKVGHHGSNTSSSIKFINRMNPKYSVISVGKNNRYGHPNKEVLDSLEHSKIYRTDVDGSIMFKIKNNKLKIETCSP